MPNGRISVELSHRERATILALVEQEELHTLRISTAEACRSIRRKLSHATLGTDEVGVLTAPNGARLVGTLERVAGVSAIAGSVRRLENGELEYEHSGSTDVDWNAQEPALRDGEIVFVDEHGDQWRESDLVVANAGETGDAKEGDGK